jgi:glycosyltransferase involved in cell wall biosynthesis
MRVLHLFAGNLYGGVERGLLTLYRHKDACPEMELNFGFCFEGRLSRELRDLNAPLFYLGSPRTRRPWSVWRARRMLLQLLSKQKFDRVVTNSPWIQAMFGSPIRKSGIMNMLRLHDPPDGRHWVQRWAKFHRPDRVLCNSIFTQQILGNLYKNIPSDVLYGPVPNGCESISAAESAKVRSALGLSPETVVLIQIGRMEQFKGHVLMLQSLSLLRDVPGWVCLVVGGVQRDHEAVYLQDLQQKAAAWGIADRVRFLGQRKDIFELLSASDVYVQANVGPETFGLVFIEALYAGLPVVTTALGGATEILSGDYGLLTPPGDAKAFAEAVRKLIADPALRSKYKAAGPGRADALCNPARQTLQFYEFMSCKQKSGVS